MLPNERTAAEWFEAASHWYVEHHQSCPWCGEAYCVYQTIRDQGVEYDCSNCDFRTGHDVKNDHFFSVPGLENGALKPDTMHEI